MAAPVALLTALGQVEPAGSSGWAVLGAALLALLFGALVGMSEILTRYRDEPLSAVNTLYGWVYVSLNALVSLAAFVLLRSYRDEIFPAIQDAFLTAIVAGFGGMLVMRSKLFTFNSADGKEVAIGPAIVIDTFLETCDRNIDRRRAAARQKRVFDKLSGFVNFKGAGDYLVASLLSFQNLSTQQKGEIAAVIEEYEASAWDDRLKVMALGFAFLTIAGEDNFDQVVDKMMSFYAADEEPEEEPPPTAG